MPLFSNNASYAHFSGSCFRVTPMTKAQYIKKIQELMSVVEEDNKDLKCIVESSIYSAQEAMDYISALHKEHGSSLEHSVKRHLNSLYATILDGFDNLCDVHDIITDTPSQSLSRLPNKRDN